MKIHLLRSDEMPISSFAGIIDIIKNFRGPIEFIARKEDLTEKDDELSQEIKVMPWDALFSKCQDYRGKKKLKDDELVCLLTEHRNEKNWFSSWDPSGRLNFFVQTSGWEELSVEGDSCYPVIYELATIPLFTGVANNLQEVLDNMAHETPRGCAFDLCRNKKDVSLRLRTGDICSDCRDRMAEKGFDRAAAGQIFRILEHIRGQMLFRERFDLTIGKLSPVIVGNYSRKLKFPEFDNKTVKLQPKEMAVYRFYIKHTEGVRFSYMQKPQHYEEMKEFYSHYSPSDDVKISTRARAIVENRDDLLSQLIYHINKKILAAIGIPEIAKHYQVNGEAGGRRFIPVERNLVRIE